MAALRRIRPEAPTAYVGPYFEPANADDTMDEICRIVDWYRLGQVYREPEDAILNVLMRLQRSQMFGEPVPPPVASAELQALFTKPVLRAAE